MENLGSRFLPAVLHCCLTNPDQHGGAWCNRPWLNIPHIVEYSNRQLGILLISRLAENCNFATWTKIDKSRFKTEYRSKNHTYATYIHNNFFDIRSWCVSEIRYGHPPCCVGVDWKWRTWKWRTIKIAGHEIAARKIDGPSCRAWNCRTRKWRTKLQGLKL